MKTWKEPPPWVCKTLQGFWNLKQLGFTEGSHRTKLLFQYCSEVVQHEVVCKKFCQIVSTLFWSYTTWGSIQKAKPCLFPTRQNDDYGIPLDRVYFTEYMYKYICIHTGVYEYEYSYIYVCIHSHTCIYIYMYIHISMYIRKHIYICIYIYIYIYIYVCVYVICIFIFTHKH